MPMIVLIFIFVLFVLVSFGVVIETRGEEKIGFGFLCVAALIGFWLYSSGSTPNEVIETQSLEVVQGERFQYISVETPDNIEIVNVTKKFGRVFPDGTKLNRNKMNRMHYWIEWISNDKYEYEVVLPELKQMGQ